MSHTILRQHLVAMLQTGHAHFSLEKAVEGLKENECGVRPGGFPHTAWQLLEHLRIAQWDILEFSRNPDHVSPQFPEGYWPDSEAPPDPAAWDGSLEAFQRDLEAMCSLVSDPALDLYEPFPHGDGQTLLREALTLASHNSYHIGQLASLRKAIVAARR